MGIRTPYHPEITTGPLENFGFHKLKRQIKSIYVNMMRDYFSYTHRIHGLDISELDKVSDKNDDNSQKLFIERDFPFSERKLPLIIPTIGTVSEVKPFLGNDNYLYQSVTVSEDGSKSGYDVYANMVNADVVIYVIAESFDLRDRLSELLFMCFTNYYRGNYIYKDDSDNMYSIVPSTRKVVIGDESEITNEDNMNLVYIVNISLRAFVEYHYKAVGEDRYKQRDNIIINPTSEEGEAPWKVILTE